MFQLHHQHHIVDDVVLFAVNLAEALPPPQCEQNVTDIVGLIVILVQFEQPSFNPRVDAITELSDYKTHYMSLAKFILASGENGYRPFFHEYKWYSNLNEALRKIGVEPRGQFPVQTLIGIKRQSVVEQRGCSLKRLRIVDINLTHQHMDALPDYQPRNLSEYIQMLDIEAEYVASRKPMSEQDIAKQFGTSTSDPRWNQLVENLYERFMKVSHKKFLDDERIRLNTLLALQVRFHRLP